jgi:uncharacterized repeat protein (TIGR03847 family)
MGDSYDFDELDGFIPAAVGPPGQRVFYVQARAGDRVVAFRLEKQQVAAIGTWCASYAAEHGATIADRDVTGLIEPVEPRWVVGSVAVAIEESTGRAVITFEELVDVDSEEDFTDEDADQLLDAAEASFRIRPEQALAFAETTGELMTAGRQPCRLCGRPMEPEGHACPRWN